VKFTVIGLAIVVAGTAAVLLFYQPAPPVVPLPPPETPHLLDPNTMQTTGDHPNHQQPQLVASAPPQLPVDRAPGSAAMPPVRPGGFGSVGSAGKGGPDTGSEGGSAGADGGKAKHFPPDKEGIREAMRSAIPEIRECYESWLATDPKLGGKMTLSFSIAPTDAGGGSVQDLSVSSKDIAHLPFEGCVKNVMAGLQFDSPYDDSTGNPAPMKVNYPLVFASNDGG
jgi:hypothetical protein